MDRHRHTDIYAYDVGCLSLNDIDTWNNDVLSYCDQSISPVWPVQETCHPQNQTINALKRYPFNSEAPERTTNGTATEPAPLAPPIEESHVVLGGPTSPVTLGHGSEVLTFPPRFSTPTLTDGSTIVGSHFWTSPSIHSNESIRNPNELADRSFSVSVPPHTGYNHEQKGQIRMSLSRMRIHLHENL